MPLLTLNGTIWMPATPTVYKSYPLLFKSKVLRQVKAKEAQSWSCSPVYLSENHSLGPWVTCMYQLISNQPSRFLGSIAGVTLTVAQDDPQTPSIVSSVPLPLVEKTKYSQLSPQRKGGQSQSSWGPISNVPLSQGPHPSSLCLKAPSLWCQCLRAPHLTFHL